MKNKPGSPKGGRVHWLLYNLPLDFKSSYCLFYNYNKHNYVFYRMFGRKLYDVFIVKHTSRHYWRVMYACPKFDIYEFFGYRNTRMIAEYMFELFLESNNLKKR